MMRFLRDSIRRKERQERLTAKGPIRIILNIAKLHEKSTRLCETAGFAELTTTSAVQEHVERRYGGCSGVDTAAAVPPATSPRGRMMMGKTTSSRWMTLSRDNPC